jgi:sec-independent protein translocase protein TatC
MSDQESFMSHLIEMRQRLVRAVGAVLALFVIFIFWPGSGAIYDFLAAPLMTALPEGAKMIATGVITPMVQQERSPPAAFVVAPPYRRGRSWPPASTYETEGRGPGGGSALFVAGIAFCYTCSRVFAFIHAFRAEVDHAGADIEAYFRFVITMFLPRRDLQT